MEMIINSSYLITIGTLIGYERKMKCKELAGTKEKNAYKQIPFCEGICCVQTYRNIEKATLEVKTPIYKELLQKLDYEMNYDDALYKEINYRLRNLNDAIEKYDLESVFLIVEKLNKLVPDNNDIYYKYLLKIVDVIYRYYKSNDFPSIDNIDMMKQVYMGFPVYIKDIIIDLLFKYALLNIIDNMEYKSFIENLKLSNSSYIPNQINNLQYLCYRYYYDDFYNQIDDKITKLKNRELYIRLLDIYDLKIIADLNTDPTRINMDIDKCNENVQYILNKLKVKNVDEIKSKTIKTKLSQHYYNLGYTLMMDKRYTDALDAFEKSISLDDLLEILCKVLLFNCYDRLGLGEEKYKKFLKLNRKYSNSNKNYVLFKYFEYKYKNSNLRERLKYIKKYVWDKVLPEDTILIKIMFYEINSLSKATSNYQILQEFIEKMGIID